MNDLINWLTKLPTWESTLYLIGLMVISREVIGFFLKTGAIVDKLSDIERKLDKLK